jgi:uncharacterized protein YbjT (DUF2867 family)
MGRALSQALLARGHQVCALVRPGSEARAVPKCEVVTGNPFDRKTYGDALAGVDSFVHLVGVAHPNPSRAAEFRSIDLASAIESIEAARAAGIPHFVYVSVAQPAPIMREYIAARQEGEAKIRSAGLNATVLRPWYVLGPGRRWPLLLLPAYFVMGLIPKTRAGAQRLGLVTRAQMVAALATAVEQPARGIRIVEVPQIRASRL